MKFKTIIQGRFDFVSEKGYRNVQETFLRQLETHYRNDVAFDVEEIFDEEKHAFIVARINEEYAKKTVRNTKSALEYVAQYAVNGFVNMWVKHENGDVDHYEILPSGDRKSVMSANQGFKVLNNNPQEAIPHFENAIKAYSNHSRAMYGIGRSYELLEDFDLAEKYYTKSIELYDDDPEPFYGRACVYAKKGNMEAYLKDLDAMTKSSVALQPIHLRGRFKKGLLLNKNGEYKKAKLELGFFCTRDFGEDDINYNYRRVANYTYGMVTFALGEFDQALKSFDNTLKIEHGQEFCPEGDVLYQKSLTLTKLGKKKDALKAMKAAAGKKSKEAMAFLKK